MTLHLCEVYLIQNTGIASCSWVKLFCVQVSKYPTVPRKLAKVGFARLLRFLRGNLLPPSKSEPKEG